MSGPKRSDFQREHDYNVITGHYLKGVYQSEIAKILGLTQGQISQDIKTIQARWRKSTTFNLDEHKAMELAKLDELERTAWDAWEKSTGERTKARQVKSGEAVMSASMEKEQRDGNPAFLDTVLKCIDRRVKILGIDAPAKIESRTVDKDGNDVLPVAMLQPGYLDMLKS